VKAAWILVATALVTLPLRAAESGAGRSDVQSLSDGATYPVGTVVGGPCQHNGALPEDARDVESIDEVFEATKLVTPRGSEVFLSPPGCEPVTLAEPGEYTAIVNQVTTHWKKTRTIRLKQTSGEVKETAYFSKTSDGDIKTYRFSVKNAPEPSAAPPADSCQASKDDWKDRAEEDADAYRQALEQSLKERATIQSLLRERNSTDDDVRRAAEAGWSDIQDGLDGMRDDCVRIAHALNDLKGLCEEVSDCSEDLAVAMAAGPGFVCLAVQEAFTSFRAGASTRGQAYAWFKKDMPCLAMLYDEGEFEDLVGALASARQPLAGFYNNFDGSPREATGN